MPAAFARLYTIRDLSPEAVSEFRSNDDRSLFSPDRGSERARNQLGARKAIPKRGSPNIVGLELLVINPPEHNQIDVGFGRGGRLWRRHGQQFSFFS